MKFEIIKKIVPHVVSLSDENLGDLEQYLCLDHLVGHKVQRVPRWHKSLNGYGAMITQEIKAAIIQMTIYNIPELTMDTLKGVSSQLLCDAAEIILYNNDKIKAKVLGGKLILTIKN